MLWVRPLDPSDGEFGYRMTWWTVSPWALHTICTQFQIFGIKKDPQNP